MRIIDHHENFEAGAAGAPVMDTGRPRWELLGESLRPVALASGQEPQELERLLLALRDEYPGRRILCVSDRPESESSATASEWLNAFSFCDVALLIGDDSKEGLLRKVALGLATLFLPGPTSLAILLPTSEIHRCCHSLLLQFPG